MVFLGKSVSKVELWIIPFDSGTSKREDICIDASTLSAVYHILSQNQKRSLLQCGQVH